VKFFKSADPVTEEPNTVAVAEASLQEQETRATDYANRKAAAETRLAGLLSSAGDAVLNGGDVTRLAREISDTRAQVDVLSTTIISCQRRVVGAKRDLTRAKAQALREQAATLRTQREKIVQDTAPLLRELSALEHVPYGRGILHLQKLGTWTMGRVFAGGMVDVGPVAPDEAIPFLQCSPDPMRDSYQLFATPKSEALRAEAETLEAQAAKLEADCA
jgi:hypothetical protein